MDGLSFRLANEADLPFLVELRQATMASHEVASGLVRSTEQSLQRVHASFEVAQIILLAGQPVGVLKVLRHGPEWELLQIQLAPVAQGQGLGSHILRALLSEAKAAGVALRLGVLKENPARRLYERLGFAVVREKEYSYEMSAGT